MNKTTIRRSRPAKPIRTQAVERTKQASSEEALEFLNQFVQQARKEIRKREELTLKGKFHHTDCDSVSFLCDKFSLTINFAEGIRV